MSTSAELTLLRYVRRPEVAQIGSALRAGGGLLTVAADTAQEAVWLRRLAVAELDDSWGTAQVDLTRCVSTRDLAIQLVRAVAEMDLGAPGVFDVPVERLPDDQRRRLYDLADRRGRVLLDAARGTLGEDDDNSEGYMRLIGLACDMLTRRAAEGAPTVLSIDAADELVELPRRTRARFSDVRDVLWLMRGRLQGAIATPSVVLAGGPATTDLVSEPDAAFFGWGTEVTVEPTPLRLFDILPEWLATHRGASPPVAREAADTIVQLVQGSVPAAERVLSVLALASDSSPASQVMRAWSTLLELNADLLRQTVRALSSLDRLALPVAHALAHGLPPYSIAEAPHGSEVAKALSALRITGFALSRKRGEWRLADPLLAAWLREVPASGYGAIEAARHHHSG